MKEKVQEVLEHVRPALQADGGDVELVDVTEDGVVSVRLTGACGSCPMSTMTLKMGIERTLKTYRESKRSSRYKAILKKEAAMIKVKTFGEPLKPFKVHQELDELDARVNRFIADNGINKVVSLSDTATTEEGSTIGLIRTLVYEE